MDQGVSLGLVVKDGLRDGRLGLREEREDSGTGVTTNDGDDVFGSLGGVATDGGDESRRSEAVEGGDTEESVSSPGFRKRKRERKK